VSFIEAIINHGMAIMVTDGWMDGWMMMMMMPHGNGGNQTD
jgi:hypothetical protein